jgi:hypothetical protein
LKLRREDRKRQGFQANQIAIATMATIIAHHTSGVTFFELPLRGESLAAWLNSLFIRTPVRSI